MALATVALVGIEQGVVAAALIALAYRARLTARPRGAVLGREPGTAHWIETDVGRPTDQVPGVLVYLLYAPLFYGNAVYVVQRLRRALATPPTAVHTLVLDANGIADVDYTGAKALGELIIELRKNGVCVALARASHLVHHDLKHAGPSRSSAPTASSPVWTRRCRRSAWPPARRSPGHPPAVNGPRLPITGRAAMLVGCRQP